MVASVAMAVTIDLSEPGYNRVVLIDDSGGTDPQADDLILQGDKTVRLDLEFHTPLLPGHH